MINVTKTKVFRFAVSLVAIVVFCTFLVCAVPSHTTQFYVNDYADVLSAETEAEILNNAVSLNNETTAQVVVLTVPDLGGEEISDFAVETLRDWGIGSKDKDNGVIIVLAIEERQVWVSVGYGLEGTLTDIRTGQLQSQYAVPYYRNNDFDTGTLMLFNAIVNEIRTEEYGLEPLNNSEMYGHSALYVNDIELNEGDLKLFLLIFGSPFLLIGFVMLCQTVKYLHLLRYDKKHGTNKAPIYRQKYMGMRQAILAIIVHGALRGGFRGGRGGGRGGFGGGGFRGGGGSGGGGGAGRGF